MTDEELRAKAHGLAVKLGVCQDPDDDGPRTVCSMNCDDIFDALREVAEAGEVLADELRRANRLLGEHTSKAVQERDAALARADELHDQLSREKRAHDDTRGRELAAEAKLGEAVGLLRAWHPYLLRTHSGGCPCVGCHTFDWLKLLDARPSPAATEPAQCGCGWCSKCRRRYCYMEGAHVCAPPPTVPPGSEAGQGEAKYPCADCGLLRTKDEGGTTFTVCDACWDKHYKKPAPTPGVPAVCSGCGGSGRWEKLGYKGPCDDCGGTGRPTGERGTG